MGGAFVHSGRSKKDSPFSRFNEQEKKILDARSVVQYNLTFR
jgi:hypothetical protein